MKAVVMAGGEGTRLRPMTANQPKPLLPVVNRPIMEHVLRLLKRHGFTETVVTVQFLAALVRNYFGDGDELGMNLYYATEERPLGTAGSVKNAADRLRDEPFLVISGDALTDIDLTDMIDFHRENGALVTIGLKRVPNPLEFGIVIVDEQGRVERFLEKPTWGQVFSDTVNTGVYVMEPEVLDEVTAAGPVDWSADVFPKLLERGAALFGYVADGYWEDVGTHESYLRVQADVLSGRVKVDIGAFELSPGVWVAEGAVVDPDAILKGPLRRRLRQGRGGGRAAGVHRARQQRGGPRGRLPAPRRRPRQRLRRAEHQPARLRDRQEHRPDDGRPGRGERRRRGRVHHRGRGVRLLRSQDLPVQDRRGRGAGQHQRHLGVPGQRNLFGPRGVSGLVNVEITPELCVRLASAYATTLKKGTSVVTSRDSSRAARALKRAVISALNASAIDVLDLEAVPLPVSRFHTAKDRAVGGIALRTTSGDPQSVDIVFMDESGADLSQSAQRRLERVFSRQEFRRAFPGEIAELSFPAGDRGLHERAAALREHERGARRRHEGRGRLRGRHFGAGAAEPPRPGRGGRADRQQPPGRGLAHRDLRRAPPRPAAPVGARQLLQGGVRGAVRPGGERVALVNEAGQLISEERALLVVLDLVAAERRGGRVALPVTTTRVAEQVCRFHGVQVEWTSTAIDALTSASRGQDMVFAGDGRGGFIVPEFGPAVDGLAVFLRLLGLVARTRLSLSQIDARIPAARLLRRTVPTPWAAKGAVMRSVIEAAEGYRIDTTDGVRVVADDGSWALVLPDPAEAVTHLWAEASDADSAQALLERWAQVVEDAAGT
nr:hypothetical protein GCM10020093_015630 [Planobispora longispora]